MRTISRFMAISLPIAAVLAGWWLRSAHATDVVAIRANIEVAGATQEQLALARWAVMRFEIAGLEPPELEIAFHGDASGCAEHMGYARAGHVDVCTVLANEMSRRNLLHEMSHIWLDQHVGAETRFRLLRERGLRSWNSSRDPWELRGYEQGAEIMAWALGDRILRPQIPNDEIAELDLAFRLLTGILRPR